MRALWCEHHDDFLVELATGRYIAVQVKTDGGENSVWRLSDDALINAITRFCALEAKHGSTIEAYEFHSNAAGYIPGTSAKKDKTIAKSPERLLHCCREAASPSALHEPYVAAFNSLLKKVGVTKPLLFAVLRKLQFCQGPPLRGYDDTLAASVIPNLPACSALPSATCCQLRDQLIGLIQGACRLSMHGVDGALVYLESNGRPAPALRGKCLTPESVQELIASFRHSSFQFVDCGMGLKLGDVPGRAEVLQRKMRNAYIGGQFESLRIRMDSAEQRLAERALLQPEGFDAVANQLVAAVFVECADAEALSYDNSDEKTRGPAIYKEILQRMDHLATHAPERVCREPKDTLMGVAAMLSGECKFAWGTPLEDTLDGA